jgi:hypothetical protein
MVILEAARSGYTGYVEDEGAVEDTVDCAGAISNGKLQRRQSHVLALHPID